MDLAALHPLLPLWSELDRVYVQSEYGRWLNSEPGASLWPWESDNPALRTLWEQITLPENQAALEDWARGVESFNEFAKGCTLRALAECRSRVAKHADPLRQRT